MTPEQERVFDAKVEKHFKSHRELPNGKNFLYWNRDRDPVADQKYKDNYDATFRNAKSSNLQDVNCK